MKIICNRTKLIERVNIVLKAVSSKSTMPILGCLILEVNNSNIKLTTTDMELGIETLVDGEIIEPGRIALDAKFFSEIIRKLPDDIVMIETDYDYNATISCGKAKFNIVGKSGDDFPVLPTISRETSISLSQFALKEIIRPTVFSIAFDENNKIMTGELFEIENDILKAVSLDGHRISIRKIQLNNSYPSLKVIVPGKTLNEVSKILSDNIDKNVNIFFTDKHMLFEFDNTTVVSRLIEGEYFKIAQMLSNDYETKLTVNKQEFLSCIERASLLIRESDKNPLIVNVNGDNMELKVSSKAGNMNEDVNIVKEGTDIVIGFNPKFLMDALKVIDDEFVDIYLINSKAPCFIKDKEENYIYLILPVNIIVNN